MAPRKDYKNILVENAGGITTVTLNRPDKRNAMSPALDEEMLDCILALEADPETRVLVLTGAGDAWSAGMDLKLYFRGLDGDPAGRVKAEWTTHQWRWYRLYNFPKPTIAMVNGYCFGGAFTQLVACDFAIAADTARFGLSEINWGVIPGGLVSKVLGIALNYRDSLYYALTGESFDATQAAQMGLINKVVPAAKLHDEVMQLARQLSQLNPETARATKQAVKTVRDMSIDQAHEYLMAKGGQLAYRDKENGYALGIKQFIDDKSFRPGLQPYARPTEPQRESTDS
ncbi:MAG: p-hydroxycinnamoyl CoA hydratase/lyase [Xanthobacteraceae bacterium]|nr:p-hydroxycinnamoyl CoA hydratase/lyase [Xanthobacteraceae bacterium]